MKIINALKSGTFRSFKSWKGILIIWFFSLLLVCLVALPLKASLLSGFGKSMITEKLTDGINIEVFTDLGSSFRSIISFFSSGLIMLMVISILINAFLTGGLFNNLRGSSEKFSASEFFRAAAKNFWSFLVISLILIIIISFLSFVLVIMPLSFMSQSDSPVEGSVYKAGIILGSVFLFFLLILLLVADYARAWQVTKEKSACFKAIGFGFSRTFRTFLSSYPLMIILIIIQVLFGWLVLSIIPGWKPVSGGGVFLLFLVSQILFIVKILFKTWRYGSVTSLMEQNNQKVS